MLTRERKSIEQAASWRAIVREIKCKRRRFPPRRGSLVAHFCTRGGMCAAPNVVAITATMCDKATTTGRSNPLNAHRFVLLTQTLCKFYGADHDLGGGRVAPVGIAPD